MGLLHHDHQHGSHAGHQHTAVEFRTAFALGILLNGGFVLIEATFGFLANSVALIADAGHNLSDLLGLLIAWGGAVLSQAPPSKRFTYGLRGSSILAALFNGVLLLVALGAILMEAIGRLVKPEPSNGMIVIVVAAIGIAINGFTALLFARGRHRELNIRGAFLHMAGDAAVSAGVVIAGLLMIVTGARWIDPVVSILIALVILWGTTGLLREAFGMSLAAVPKGIDPGLVERELAELPGVASVHDLHIWPMSTTENALTAHLVMPGGHPGDRFLFEVQASLHAHFDIHHATLQIETEAEGNCHLEPAHRV
ncbi:MAG: cation diffusion facilitator family transporter [Sphingomonadales bacterium]